MRRITLDSSLNFKDWKWLLVCTVGRLRFSHLRPAIILFWRRFVVFDSRLKNRKMIESLDGCHKTNATNRTNNVEPHHFWNLMLVQMTNSLKLKFIWYYPSSNLNFFSPLQSPSQDSANANSRDIIHLHFNIEVFEICYYNNKHKAAFMAKHSFTLSDKTLIRSL